MNGLQELLAGLMFRDRTSPQPPAPPPQTPFVNFEDNGPGAMPVPQEPPRFSPSPEVRPQYMTPETGRPTALATLQPPQQSATPQEMPSLTPQEQPPLVPQEQPSLTPEEPQAPVPMPRPRLPMEMPPQVPMASARPPMPRVPLRHCHRCPVLAVVLPVLAVVLAAAACWPRSASRRTAWPCCHARSPAA